MKIKKLNESSEYEVRRRNFERAKADFEKYGEEGNNDVLSREERMRIAKAEMDKVRQTNESKSIKIFGAKGKKLNEASLVDKKMSTLGKAGKPIYLTADQLKDVQAKYTDYDFEETEIDKGLPQGQKAYIAKKKNESLSESTDYKVKFFQVFEAPKSPTENGKMIGQRGTLDDANAFGKERVGEGNYIIKAVCDDGKTRNIDNDTDPSAYTLAESNDVQYGVHQFSTDSIIFRGTEEECGKYIDKNKKLWDDAEVYRMEPGDPHYKKDLDEASYGGAYDIEDDQYFTRDDLNSFAEEVLNHVSETFDGKYDIGGVWFENGNVTTQIVDEEGNEFQDTTHVDMRRIREPWHLKRMYAFPVATSIIAQITSFLKDSGVITENVRGQGEYSDKFYDYLDYLEDNGDSENLSYLVSQLIRYCKEEDLKDLWFDRMGKVATDNGFGVKSDVNDENKQLKESVEDEAATAQRYLDVEIPDACRTLVDIIPGVPENILLSMNNRFRKFYSILEYYINGYGSKNESLTESDSTTKNVSVAFDVTVPVKMSEDAIEHELRRKLKDTDLEINSYVEIHTLNESLTEDVEVPTLTGPVEGAESGLAALLNEALQDELKTIQMYNDTAITARAEGFDDIASQIDEINTEENKHVGQLQELLKTVSPNAQAIDAGELEAGDDLVVVEECINNSDKTGNNNNEGDVIVEGKERWEQIYNSFKAVEQELNNDGEAVTAVVDKMYQDNKDDPDYKKAYDKWSCGE